VERAHNGEVNAAYGFESEQQAMDFVTGYPDAKDYTIYGVTSKRVPLGIPDGMVLRSPYSFTSAEVAKDKAKSDAQAKVDAETAHKQSIQDAVNAAIAERDRAQTSSHVNNPVVKPSDAKRD
jgi:hypothetical protein